MSTEGYQAGGVNSIGQQVTFMDQKLPSSPAKGVSLWQTCPILAALSEPMSAFHFYDDFFTLYDAATGWVKTQATSGTMTVGTDVGGTVLLSAGASTQHQGEQMQLASTAFKPAANASIWFETRLQINTILQAELFFGLAATDTTIIAAGAMTTSDYIGIKSVTSDSVLLPCVCSGSTETAGTTIGTLAASTYVNLGFVVTSNTSVQFYVNGVATGSAITTNIPSVVLTPSFVCQAGAAAGGTPILKIDWVRCLQLR